MKKKVKTATLKNLKMIEVSEATSILAKIIAGGQITDEEQQALDEYASRFNFNREKKCLDQ